MYHGLVITCMARTGRGEREREKDDKKSRRNNNMHVHIFLIDDINNLSSRWEELGKRFLKCI